MFKFTASADVLHSGGTVGGMFVSLMPSRTTYKYTKHMKDTWPIELNRCITYTQYALTVYKQTRNNDASVVLAVLKHCCSQTNTHL